MTNKVDLENFTGQNNFNMWRIKMEALLITQGLGDAINPVIKSEDAEASSSRTPEQMAEIDKKARSTIILSLGDSVIREVAKEKTVAGLWAKLEQLYMTKSLANRLYIKKKMFSMRMIEGASLDEHIDEFNKVCDELEPIDEGLSDESKALLLISSLPKSYEHFVDALLYGRDLTQVRHVPELKRNLISIGMLDQTGCVIKAKNWILKASVTEKSEDKARLWHLRLGHMSERGLKELQKKRVFGSDKLNSLGFCEDCILGKASSLKFESAVHSTKKKLAYIHSDLWGPAQVDSLGGCRSPSTTIECKTPIELWSGRVADYSKLRIFGCVAYAHVKQGKLEPRALRCRFLGYPDGVKGYSLWCIDLKPPKCIISRDVTFNESEILNKSKTTESKEYRSETRHESVQFEVESHEQDMTELVTEEDAGRVADGSDDVQESEPTENERNSYQLVRDRKRRAIRPPKRYAVADLIAYALTTAKEVNEEEPRTYKEVMNSRDKLKWKKAMDEEIESLMKNETWKLIVRPEKMKTVSCKWIFKVKEYISNAEPSRVILALVAIQDMYLEQMDVKTTFLHGELQEEIVMEQPEGYVVSGKEDHVCLLKKSLYGLKQSPRQWDIGDGKMIYLMLYVDDMLIACHSINEISHLKDLLSSEFDMKDLGVARKILGMEIIRDRRRKLIFLTQQSYVKKVLLRFGMHESKSVQTPLANHFKLSAAQCPQTDAKQEKMSRLPYSSAVGSLMYAMVLTRPYIFTCSLSTTEAEYTVAAEAFKEAIWLKGMVSELGAKQETVEVYCDSQSAIHLSKNQTHHEITKHIDVKLHFVRLEVSKGIVKMLKVHTDQNPADMLTKAVPYTKFNFCLSLAGICSF
ncbi:hypothetical protein KPL71_021739 [Citrus sinensis]|uniref:Uncharacterized protein n=1 Tax=Citrus sinensis TaxID=2711 RepID=A0ACB8JJX6_CITSI|nr:hypothetical protein KPL71_021739 [Citrus sinensis]